MFVATKPAIFKRCPDIFQLRLWQQNWVFLTKCQDIFQLCVWVKNQEILIYFLRILTAQLLRFMHDNAKNFVILPEHLIDNFE